MPHMTGGEAVIHCLKAYGVDAVFGIPGVHNLPLYEALRHAPNIQAITTRHEGGAAFMADGYARATGRPGVCLTITGPGAANALAALGNAYGDSSPVLLIATEVASTQRGRGLGAFHEFPDQLAMLRGATGRAEQVTRVEDIPAAIARAFEAMLSGRPRPAALEFPLDVLRASADIELAVYQPTRHAGEATAIAEAVQLLARAQQPLIYAGSGVLASGAMAELVALAERLNAPVFTTCCGRGAIPEDHPLALGYGWMWPNAPFGSLLAKADVVLAVGTSLGAVETRDATLPIPPTLIHVDIDPTAPGRSYPTRVPIIGDAKVVLGQLLQRSSVMLNAAEQPRSAQGDNPAVAQRIAELRAEGQARVANKVGWQMIQAVRASLPRDAIITGDAAAVNGWQVYHLPVYEPYTAPFPMHTAALGFAVPAAIGAKVAQPDRVVVAIAGDGGFMFTAQDLATAVHYGVNIIAIVFNDNGYRSIEAYQRRFYGTPYGGELSNPDFVAFAQSFGALGLCAATPAELADALNQALAADRPVLIEVPIQVESAVWA